MQPAQLGGKVTDDYIDAAIAIGHKIMAFGSYQTVSVEMNVSAEGTRYTVEVASVLHALGRQIIAAAMKEHVTSMTWKHTGIVMDISLRADAVRVFRMICRKIGPITRFEEM